MRSARRECGRKKIRISEASTSVFILKDIGRVCVRIVCFECSKISDLFLDQPANYRYVIAYMC